MQTQGPSMNLERAVVAVLVVAAVAAISVSAAELFRPLRTSAEAEQREICGIVAMRVVGGKAERTTAFTSCLLAASA